MRRESYEEIKSHRSFYRNAFRKINKVLMLSIALNILLGLGIFYKEITRPRPDFYATSGLTSPIKLNPMDAANSSSQPLLQDDPPEEVSEKELPPGD